MDTSAERCIKHQRATHTRHKPSSLRFAFLNLIGQIGRDSELCAPHAITGLEELAVRAAGHITASSAATEAAHCVAAVCFGSGQASTRFTQLGGRAGSPLSLASPLAGAVAQFLPGPWFRATPVRHKLKNSRLEPVFAVVATASECGLGSDDRAELHAFIVPAPWFDLTLDMTLRSNRTASHYTPSRVLAVSCLSNDDDGEGFVALLCAKRTRWEVALRSTSSSTLLRTGVIWSHSDPRDTVHACCVSREYIVVLLSAAYRFNDSFDTRYKDDPRILVFRLADFSREAEFCSLRFLEDAGVVVSRTGPFVQLLTAMCFLPDGKHIAASCAAFDKVLVFSVTGALTRIIAGAFGALDIWGDTMDRKFDIACTYTELLTLSNDARSINVFDIDSGEHMCTLHTPETRPAHFLFVAAHGATAFAVDADQETVHVWHA